MQRFKELIVWQKSKVFVKLIYTCTSTFPKEEIYLITSQIKRANVSIATNIAESARRRTNPQFVNFLDIALGSDSEVENLLILSHNLTLVDEEAFKNIETNGIEI